MQWSFMGVSQLATREAMMPTDLVEQCGLDSFPASDPPSWWTGEVRAPTTAPPGADPSDAVEVPPEPPGAGSAPS